MHPGAQTSGHVPGQVWLTKKNRKEQKYHLAHITLGIINLCVLSRSDIFH